MDTYIESAITSILVQRLLVPRIHVTYQEKFNRLMPTSRGPSLVRCIETARVQAANTRGSSIVVIVFDASERPIEKWTVNHRLKTDIAVHKLFLRISQTMASLKVLVGKHKYKIIACAPNYDLPIEWRKAKEQLGL